MRRRRRSCPLRESSPSRASSTRSASRLRCGSKTSSRTQSSPSSASAQIPIGTPSSTVWQWAPTKASTSTTPRSTAPTIGRPRKCSPPPSRSWHRSTLSSPGVVTVSNELGEPRYPQLRQIMMAAKKEVKPWTLSDLGISAPQNRINLEALFVPETKVETEWIEGDTPQEKAEKLATRLREAKLI